MKNKQIIKTDKFITDYCYIARVIPFELIKEYPALSTLYSVIITKSLPSLQGEKEYHDFVNTNYGARFVFTYHNYGHFFLCGIRFETVQSKYLPEKTDCFGNMLLKAKEALLEEPLFNDDLIEKNKREFISYLKKRDKTPSYIAYHKAFLQIDENHLFNFDSVGSVEDVSKITKEMLIEFHHKLSKFPFTYLYEGSNDEHQKERLDEFIKDDFELPVYVDEPFKIREYVHHEETFDAPNTNLEMIYHFDLPYSLQNTALLNITNSIIGGANSILFNEIREKLGLCYSIYSSCYNSENVMEIVTQISSENLKDTMENINKIISSFSSYFNEEYFEKAKMDAVSSLIDQQDNASSLFSHNISVLYKRGRINDYEATLKSLQEVTYDDVINFVSTFKLISSYAVKGDK